MAELADPLAGILHQVRHRPQAPALHWRGTRVTYGGLYERARRECDRIARLDSHPGEPVAVLADKSPEAVALILACLLLRRPFLLPSTALADTQLADLAAQAGCRQVLTPEGAPGRPLPPGREQRRTPPPGTTFMLTTSGSTGLPKVVPLEAAAVHRFAAWAAPAFGIGPGTPVLNYAPLNFDLCLLDVWASLARGAQVVLVDPERGLDGRYLLDLVLGYGVQVVQAVPMAHGLLADAAAARGADAPSVRHALFTGDVMPERTLSALPGLFPRARLYNVYGCTETNDSFVHEVPRAEARAAQGPPPIGTPLPGVRALVLDERGQQIDGAGAGELYVRTPFQSPGYLDAAKRAERFAGHPLGQDDGRWYRTGDLVERDAAGCLRLTGRADFQVKIRGTAVNTAEVERVLLKHPDVLEAGVAAVADPETGRRLVSAVHRAPGSGLNSLTLRGHLSRNLPRAAVPPVLRISDEPLAKTPTGKVDRGVLDHPAGGSDRRREAGNEPTAKGSPL
ncbi:AMP-binding protein [Streptomonospora litoralis]|uniref:Linear gramicidin synthase subunit B n=1 Tax=Streptomonospora litoralis TaxID=2498135 RepID=A0A4P6Q7I5_9ACTN|nr:AMP-binding protein [Streptomonospora litoralis]QBI54924.1 Linear gramicidin synthase subunit B [Streptomonospora litoralis]